MRIRATASGNQHSNAIGQVELSCTPAGLSVGLFGVGPYAEGYATGALAKGTRFTVSYQSVVAARAYGDQLQLQFDSPGFPHDRLTLTRFSAGPGVPMEELRRRRLILHLGALSFAALAALSAVFLAPVLSRSGLAWSAAGYGFCAGAIVLAFGYALDHTFFVRPPGEDATRQAFVRELAAYVPSLVSTDGVFEPKREKKTIDFTQLMPKTAVVTGIVMAATILSALVLGQSMFMSPSRQRYAERTPAAEVSPDLPTAPSPPPVPTEAPPEPTPAPVEPAPTEAPLPQEPASNAQAEVERRCLCDRADSELWKNPIPRLSALLIEKRRIPTKTHLRTQVQVAVINNSDTPMKELTIHVQFYETRGSKRRATKERPLYFEGPLRPGHAIKWTAEARGDSYEILVPDFGQLGPNGDGSASAENFVELLEANHRPVRLHAARMLSYLGDPRAREAALHLKDAMRAAEGPYLRRVLMATGDFRVCDTELRKQDAVSLGACVYNATDQKQKELGIQLNALSGSLDVQQPLADPPELRDNQKWSIPGDFPPQSGQYVRVPVPSAFLAEKGATLEVLADRYDLLD